VFSIRYEKILYIIQDNFIAKFEAACYGVLVQKGRSWRVDVGWGGSGAAFPGNKLGGKMKIINKILIFCPKEILNY
jgi:hypothetical protein